MIVEQKTLYVNQYRLRGLFSYPENGFKNIVIMFHGFTGHKNEHGYLFKQLTETLVSNGYATLRYDFMGNGESDGSFTDYTFFTEITDGIAIVKEAYMLNHNQPIILMGFSMGGAVASRVSLEVKELIERLILLSPAGNMPEIINMKFKLKEVDEFGNIDMGGYYMNKAIQEAFEGFDMYEGIHTFEKPVLIIQGGSDTSVPPKYSRKYHDLYPNSSYYLIEGSEHGYAKVEYRKLIHKKIKEFLN